jgi:hypothetical protein
MSKKHVDSIDMNVDAPHFTSEPEIAAVAAEDKGPVTETFEREGVKIYTKDENGNVTYFDTDGKEVSSRVVDTLFEKYPAPPEFNQQGGEKKGDLQVRNSVYQKHGNEKFESGKEPEYVVERQEYTEGDTHITTIHKELYPLVKFLRGDFS